MRGHGANQDLVALFTNVRQILNAPKVHNQLGLSEPKLHRRYQTMTTRQYLRLIGALGEQGDRLVQSRGGLIVELCRNHDRLLTGSAGVLARRFYQRRWEFVWRCCGRKARDPRTLLVDYFPDGFWFDGHVQMPDPKGSKCIDDRPDNCGRGANRARFTNTLNTKRIHRCWCFS